VSRLADGYAHADCRPCLPDRKRIGLRIVRTKLLSLTVAGPIGVAAPAGAHQPGTDGSPADRRCHPVNHGPTYVGATRVSCRVAREVVRGVKRGESFSRWRCTWSIGRAFGHCHGRGIRTGGIVHWAVND